MKTETKTPAAPKLDTPADYTLWKLDQDIAYQTDRITEIANAVAQEMDIVLKRLSEGGTPNTCGVLQSRNTELDMAVARLDALQSIRSTLKGAMEFAKDKPKKEQEPDALETAAADIIDGWDGLTRGGMVEVEADDIKALRDALLARDAKASKAAR